VRSGWDTLELWDGVDDLQVFVEFELLEVCTRFLLADVLEGDVVCA